MACFFARATNQNNGLKETDYRASQNLINRKTATHIVSTFVNEFETEFFKFKTVGIIHKQCVVSLFATLIFSLPVFNNNTVQSASLLWFCCEMLHRLGDALSLYLCFSTEKYNSIVNRSEWRATDVDCYLLWKPYDLMQLKIDTFSPNTFRARVKLQLNCCALFDIKPFANRFNDMNETDWIRMMNWLFFKMRFETLLPIRRSFRQKPKL